MPLDAGDEVETVVEVADELLQDRGPEVEVHTQEPFQVENGVEKVKQVADREKTNDEAQISKSPASPVTNT